MSCHSDTESCDKPNLSSSSDDPKDFEDCYQDLSEESDDSDSNNDQSSDSQSDHNESQTFELSKDQQDVLDWMNTRERFGLKGNTVLGGILAEDAGFGKTRVVCALLKKSPKFPCLIVTPRSILHQWLPEIYNMTGLVAHVVARMPPNSNGNIFYGSLGEKKTIMLTTYNVVRRNIQSFTNTIWGRIIADEAHVLRNPKTCLFRSLSKLNGECRWALTATPVHNRDLDLFSLSKFIRLHSDEIEVIKNILMYPRQHDCHVGEEMLALNGSFEVRHIELLEHEYKYYDCLLATLSKKNKGYGALNGGLPSSNIIDDSKESKMVNILRLRQAATCYHFIPKSVLIDTGIIDSSDPQVNLDDINPLDPTKGFARILYVVSKCARMIRKDGVSGVIFCNWIEEMTLLERAFNEEFRSTKVLIFRLQGSTSESDREGMLYDLSHNVDRRIVILLCQIDCGNSGLNLQYCLSYAIIMRPQWNPAIEYQAIRRVFRRGQTCNVKVYRILAKRTIDEEMLKQQQPKITLMLKTVPTTLIDRVMGVSLIE